MLIQQLNLIIMITIPEIPAFWLTDFVTLNIQTMEWHIKDAFHYTSIAINNFADKFCKVIWEEYIY